MIAGIPGHPVEDVQISNVRIQYRGGGTTAEAAIDRPENETAYPEPSMFGTLPSYGLFVRHARGLTIRDFEVTFDKDEARPPVALVDVEGAFFDRLTAKRTAGVPLFVLKDVKNLTLRGLAGLPDLTRDVVSAGTIR